MHLWITSAVRPTDSAGSGARFRQVGHDSATTEKMPHFPTESCPTSQRNAAPLQMESVPHFDRNPHKPQARFTEQGLRHKIAGWLADAFVREVLHYELEQRPDRWRLSFRVDNEALQRLWSQRLGRTVLLTNRLDWTAEQVVEGYSGQQQIERVFRGLKDGDWLGWGPMHHWTDSKIRIHAFYCMLGVSLLQYLHRESRKVWPGLSLEQFLEELRQMQQFVLLYPPLGDKGPNRVATVLSKQTLAQQALAESLGLEQFCSTQRG